MSKKQTEKLHKIFEEAAEKSWQWLRTFSPYQNAYAQYIKRLKNKQAIPHFMTADTLHYARSDYNLSKKQAQLCLDNQHKDDSIWRMYPLLDPNNKKMPKRFYGCFKANFLTVQPAVECPIRTIEYFIKDDVEISKKEMIDLTGFGSTKPKRILLSINLQRPKETIQKEVEKIVRRYHRWTPLRPQYDNLETRYKVIVLRGLGGPIQKIAKDMFPSEYARSPQAACKKIERFLSQ